ncbi:MAG: glucose/sorbosone dehydrogenase [Bacteroidetes bacterium]|jgi:glucose/arabinose dehydrogenase|nr:glucose/sorbosone dehydrogenase [Bacteroidota bacterium]
MTRTLFILLFPFALWSQKPAIKTKVIAKNLTAPVAMDCPKDGSNRLFICEQRGKIKIIKNGKLLDKVFLDVSAKLDDIGKVYSEKGLLGIAFHPKYKTNGRFFIYYSAPPSSDDNHKSILAEYKVSSDPDVADPASESILLQIAQPEFNHNGGQLAFGPDGFLYVGLGDGGGAGDDHGARGNGQNLEKLLGKILRLDIDSQSPFAVPKDNPFTNVKDARSEIWAYGLRNPWRFSFDRKTGRLFCADVGQNKFEEVNIIKKGKNYGWRIMEGNHCFNPKDNCDTKNLELPIAEYGRDKGISVTGGFVYRGKNMPAFDGKYIFGDWKGKMYYLEESGGKWVMQDMTIEGKKNNDLDFNINSFGEDENGEIYILVQKFTGTFASNGEVLLIETGKTTK